MSKSKNDVSARPNMAKEVKEPPGVNMEQTLNPHKPNPHETTLPPSSSACCPRLLFARPALSH